MSIPESFRPEWKRLGGKLKAGTWVRPDISQQRRIEQDRQGLPESDDSVLNGQIRRENGVFFDNLV